MRRMLSCIAATTLFFLSASYTDAASLRVAPTNLELIAPDSAGVLNLTNEAKRPINIQVRVLKWSQVNGVEQLEATTDVVASPPMSKMGPNADYVIRVVRVSKVPLHKEDSYRVIVDELPDPSSARSGMVTLIVRYSIPVFFRSPDASAPDVSWNLTRTGGGLILTARNNGDSRFRLSNVTLKQGEVKMGSRSGLVGYVLGGATMQWPMGSTKSLSGNTVTLQGLSDFGPFDVKVDIKSR